MLEQIISNNNFLISRLSLQEVSFVLAKLSQPVSFISKKLNFLIISKPVNYGIDEFTRAIELAKVIGFKDFNDCLHTAIAERYCKSLSTFNYKDFKRIAPLTPLTINYL